MLNNLEPFLSNYNIVSIDANTRTEQVFTTFFGDTRVEVDRPISIVLYQDCLQKLVDDFAKIENERRKRSKNQAAQAAYDRYMQILELIPDDANT